MVDAPTSAVMLSKISFGFAVALAAMSGCKKDQPMPADPMMPPTTGGEAVPGPMMPGGDDGGLAVPDPTQPSPSDEPYSAIGLDQLQPATYALDGGIAPPPIVPQDAGTAPLPPRDAAPSPPGTDGGLTPNPGPPPSPLRPAPVPPPPKSKP